MADPLNAPTPTVASHTTHPQPWWLLVPVLLLFVVQMKGAWVPGPDAACYVSISRNLAQGEVACLGSPHLRFAPGYPILIAPAWWTPAPFWAISCIHLALVVALAAGVHAWMQRLHPPSAVWLTALVLVNASLWEAYRMTHSELAFMAAWVWAAVCLERAVRAESGRAQMLWAVAGTLLTVAASGTRQVGCLLVMGFALVQLLACWRQPTAWRTRLALTVGVGATVAAAMAALTLWDRHQASLATGSLRYDQFLVDSSVTLWQQLAEGLRMRISSCGRLLIPGMMKAYGEAGDWLNINVLIYLAFFPVLVCGWVRLVRRQPDPLLWTMPFYFALYVAWPFDQGTRFMVPVLPILWAAFAEVLASLRGDRQDKLFGGLVAAHAVLSIGAWLQSPSSEVLARNWQELQPVSAALEAQVAAAAIWDLPESQAEILRLQTNRNLPRADKADRLSLQLWIATSDAALPPGFRLQLAAGKVAIWERAADGAVWREAQTPAHRLRR